MNIEKALESWYVEGHPLRLDPLHPLLGMAGEAGELLNIYKKNEYKPDFSWLNCKYCGYGDASHEYSTKECPNDKWMEKSDYYTPLVLDELGDFWYYLRIVAWQQNLELKSTDEDWAVLDILDLLVRLADYSVGSLRGWLDDEAIAKNYLLICYEILLAILLNELDCTITQLTELNYKKLNVPDQNGWVNAREA